MLCDGDAFIFFLKASFGLGFCDYTVAAQALGPTVYLDQEEIALRIQSSIRSSSVGLCSGIVDRENQARIRLFFRPNRCNPSIFQVFFSIWNIRLIGFQGENKGTQAY